MDLLYEADFTEAKQEKAIKKILIKCKIISLFHHQLSSSF